MVREFLRAELASPRFAAKYHRVIDQHGWDAARLFANDAESAQQRRTLLGAARGYGRDAMLFKGFPDAVRWTRQAVDAAAIDRLHYGNFDEWVDLSRGTRRVLDAVRHIGAATDAELSRHIAQTRTSLRQGNPVPALIALSVTPERWVLLEGHTRATAMAAMDRLPAASLLLGHAANFSNWAYI